MRHPRSTPLPAQKYSLSVLHRTFRSQNEADRSAITIAARIALAILLLVTAVAGFAPHARAQANVTGTWQTLPTQMPINPVHVALMHNGKVLVVSGSGNYPPDTSYMAAVWDPATDTVTTMPINWDMFCNGMVVLPDGRPFVMGGTLQYDPFYGHQKTSAFDPSTGTFADQQNMADGRWYPTALVLGDGRVMVFSGLGLTGNTNTTVEYFTVGKGWSQPFNAPWTPPLYPRLSLLPNGNVFYSGSTSSSALFNPSTETWTQNVAGTIYGNTRTYGSTVLMPLTPANGFKPRVMIFGGGGSPSTNTTEIIDLSVASPKWTAGVAMSQPRMEMNATLLPSGQILASGGSEYDEDTTTPSLNADIYDSVTGARTPGGVNAFARLYHSNALLLPDATVLLSGGNPARGTYEPHLEIYTPAYLYDSSGQLAARPTITSVSSPTLGYNSAFTIQTPNASSISSVVLMRAGSVTHAFDMDQRMVGLSYTVSGTTLNATSPVNGNLAPPGYYLLFLVNSSGVPSVAQFVQLMTAPGTPPQGTITSPSSDVTIAAGQSVSFGGTGTAFTGSIASYDWVFPGGSPSSSTAASPGSVTFATPGTYVISFDVTDSSGRTDPDPPTRTITVNPGFSISAAPSTRSVSAGSPTTYTVTLTPGSGFTGTVSFNATGAPSGVTTAFSPATVTTSGTTTMNVTTTAAVTPGTYPLTINGTSAGVTVSTNISLTVTSGSSGGGNITFVQGTYSTPRGNNASTSTTFASAQTAGNLNVVILGWNDTTSTVSSVVDTAGNNYQIAAGPTKMSGNTTGVIYYARAINASTSNKVTANFSGAAAYTDMRILEYAGADPTNPLDIGGGATGTGSPATVTLTTTNASDLIVAGNYVEFNTTGAGSGYTSRMITSPDTDIVEDEMFTTAGSHPATASVDQGWWVMSAAAFRAFSGPPDTQVPTAPTNLTATVAGNTQINLSWTASTDNVGVTGYRVEQCSGASCSNFAQVGTTSGATATYNATGLTAGTFYSYRVRATDAAGNLSTYSNTASATTTAPDTQPPTAPLNLSATAASTTQINVSWTASTDNVGVTGYRVEQCSGASCSNFAQVGTTTGATTYSATGLTTNTPYSYRVRATDAAGNLSTYSNTASATTLGDTQAPTAPTNLTATAASSTQINLSWTASTDNVGVTGYRVEQCQSAGCSNFAQVGTTTGATTYSATGLTAGTSYSYRVRAADAAGNLSTYSNTASATTTTGPPPAVTFVQSAFSTPRGNNPSVAATFTKAQVAGDLNIVFIGWNDTTATLKTITDAKGNVYTLAVGPTQMTGVATQSIYYATNVAAAAAGANVLTVTFNGSAAYPDLRILEYSGAPTTNPIDAVGAAGGTSVTPTASTTTTMANDLLVASDFIDWSTTGPGSGWTNRFVTVPNSDIVEEQKAVTAGTYSATAGQNPTGWWVMQVIAIK